MSDQFNTERLEAIEEIIHSIQVKGIEWGILSMLFEVVLVLLDIRKAIRKL